MSLGTVRLTPPAAWVRARRAFSDSRAYESTRSPVSACTAPTSISGPPWLLAPLILPYPQPGTFIQVSRGMDSSRTSPPGLSCASTMVSVMPL